MSDQLPKLPPGVSDAFLALMDRPVSFLPAVARLCGTATAALMLSQAIFWSRTKKVIERDGWFWKKAEEWEEEIYLSRQEQRTAREVLRAKGFLIEEKRKIDGAPTLHFKVNFEAIIASHLGVQLPIVASNNSNENTELLGATKPDLLKNENQESTNPIRKQRLHTETIKPSASQSSAVGSDEKAKPESDPRFQRVVDTISVCMPKGSRLIFDASDGAALNRALVNGKLRNLPLEEIQILIVYRFYSDPEGTNLTESVRRWVGSLNEYQSGPRNKFAKPKYAGDHLVKIREQGLAWLKRKLAQLAEPQAQQTPLGDPPPAIKVPSDFQASAGELLWSAIVEVASRETHRNGHERWLRPTKGLGIWRGLLFVRVPTAEFKPNLEKLNELFTREIDGSPVQAIAFLTAEEFESYRFQEAAGA